MQLLMDNRDKHLHISNSKGDTTMCINKDELSNRVAEIRNLKAMKEELDNQLKSLEFDVISFMKETEQSEYIGTEHTSHRTEQHWTREGYRIFWVMTLNHSKR